MVLGRTLKPQTVALIFLCYRLVAGQLVINVKNQGGDVVQENISANVSDDTVSLEFQRPDGTLVTQFIDYKNEVQVIKAVILGEEERGQSQYQVVCFLFHFQKDSFISSDAISKLKQKNPTAVRSPEEDLGRFNYTMDYSVKLQHAGIISAHVVDLCAEAKDATYARHEDLLVWSMAQGVPEASYLTALKLFPVSSPLNEVKDTSKKIVLDCINQKNLWIQCQCRLEICIGWYPCGLKYCKRKGQYRNPDTYRCGIKTCRKCHLFSYYVDQKQQCLWDEG